jgi:arginine utilization protein RocB
LVFNSLDYLSGSSDLITIRSRGSYERPFVIVDQIEQETEQASADEVEQLNQKIQDYQQKLSQLGRSATDENVKLLQSEALAERQKIEAQMRDARKQLRVINTRKREKIEDLKQRLQSINMLVAPAIILLIAIVLAIVRFARAKRYAARRAEQ